MNNLYQLHQDFLQEWPKERIAKMNLSEYSNLNKSTSFCYWLEAKTQDLGSIWGGSAFKFGIYEKNKKSNHYQELGRLSDDEYAWMSKYGNTRDEAYSRIKQLIIETIDASEKGDFNTIDAIDLGDAFKWKIAFLYGNYKILNVFNYKNLVSIAHSLNINLAKKESFGSIQKKILETKPESKDYFEFGKEIWQLKDVAIKQYWLYSPGKQAEKWDDFYSNEIIALGWGKLGDLTTYENKKQIKEALVAIYGGESDRKNDATANDDFCNTISIGDVIIVKKGKNKLLGYGVVTSDYQFDENKEDFNHYREVDWIKRGEWEVEHDIVLKTLTNITQYQSLVNPQQKYYEYLLSLMEFKTTINQKIIDLLKYKKQIILQGPPGTGKTREAKLIAKEMLGLENINALQNNDQFKLLQFHPSYTYEDFVRGIVVKPNNDGDGIVYEAENKTLGLFAKKALDNYLDSIKDVKTLSFENSINHYFDLFKDVINDKIENANGFLHLTENVGLISTDDETAFRYRGNTDSWIKNGNRFLFRDILQSYLDGDKVRQDIRKNKNISGLARQHASYFVRILNQFQEFLKENNFDEHTVEENTSVALKNYVLVIDEINRANLSSVLGELIYALEYRGEAVESIYKVDGRNGLVLPPNLYVIGTMNTADRSVGHIDYAIRRRFAFVDILPKDLSNDPEIKFNSKLFSLVESLFDKYINSDFDKKDVQLGHSYFIEKSSEGGMMELHLEYEIKPILLEYVKDGILKESAKELIDQLSVNA